MYEIYMDQSVNYNYLPAMEAISIEELRRRVLGILHWIREKLDELKRTIRRRSDIYIPKYAYDCIEKLKTTRMNMTLNEIAKAAHMANMPVISNLLDKLEMDLPDFDIGKLRSEFRKKNGSFIRLRISEINNLISFYNNVIYITERVVKNIMDQYAVKRIGENPADIVGRIITVIATKGAKRAIKFLNICIVEGKIKNAEINQRLDEEIAARREARRLEKETMKEIKQAGKSKT